MHDEIVMVTKNMFYMNIKQFPDETVVAICDSELMGGTYREGPLKLEVTEKCYGNKLVKLKECVEVLKNTANANLVGKNIINAALEMGLVHEQSILYIKKIPHALIIF